MTLKHRGVVGNCHYNREMKAFVGELQNTDTLRTFKSGSLNGVKKAFILAVDAYLIEKTKQK